MCLLHQLTILLILLVVRIQFSIENLLPPPPAISHQLPLPPTMHPLLPRNQPLLAPPRLPPLAPVPIQNGRLMGPQMPPLAPQSTPMMPQVYKPPKLPPPPTAYPLPFNMLAMAPIIPPLANQSTSLPSPLPTPPLAPSQPPAPPTVSSVKILTGKMEKTMMKPMSSRITNFGHRNGRIPWWQILLVVMLLISMFNLA